jgi:hypothetical protein
MLVCVLRAPGEGVRVAGRRRSLRIAALGRGAQEDRQVFWRDHRLAAVRRFRARGPDEDLRLQFEAMSQLTPEKKNVARAVLEGLLLKARGPSLHHAGEQRMSAVLMPRTEGRIQVVRGLRVMIDVDLAALYGVPTKRLNEQVKRNRDRFPADFLFQLTAAEKAEVVANCDHLGKLTFSKVHERARHINPHLHRLAGGQHIGCLDRAMLGEGVEQRLDERGQHCAAVHRRDRPAHPPDSRPPGGAGRRPGRAFYGETTKRFNQQVRRNLARFPLDFMFQLDAQEFAALRLQSATLESGRGQHRKYLPLALTEHGAIMAATLLNSPRATELSVYVVRAFVELRGILLSNRELAVKVHQLERKVSTHERNIAELADSMGQLLATPAPAPKRSIGFLPVEEKKDKPAGKAASKAPPRRKV